MPDLTNHEFACLLLADEGESMLPIGIWEKPIKMLANFGFLKKLDAANYVITPEGHAARVARDENDEATLQRLLSGGKESIETAKTRDTPHGDGASPHPKVGLGDE